MVQTAKHLDAMHHAETFFISRLDYSKWWPDGGIAQGSHLELVLERVCHARLLCGTRRQSDEPEELQARGETSCKEKEKDAKALVSREMRVFFAKTRPRGGGVYENEEQENESSGRENGRCALPHAKEWWPARAEDTEATGAPSCGSASRRTRRCRASRRRRSGRCMRRRTGTPLSAAPEKRDVFSPDRLPPRHFQSRLR